MYTEIRDGVCTSTSLDDLDRVVQQLAMLHIRDEHVVQDEQLSWYVRHDIKEEMERKKLEEYKLELLRKKQEEAPLLVECDEGAELGVLCLKMNKTMEITNLFIMLLFCNYLTDF